MHTYTRTEEKTDSEEKKFEEFDTLFYQGLNSSQAQVLKYIGHKKIIATTGQLMWSKGRNNLMPIDVIENPYIGEEIADVNLNPFKNYIWKFNPIDVVGSAIRWLNPINLIGSAITWYSNWRNGFRFEDSKTAKGSVSFHAPILRNISIGQETDIESHKKKYERWKKKSSRKKINIQYGISRGTAAIFCAAEETHQETKLFIFEGAIDSVNNVLLKRIPHIFPSDTYTNRVTNALVINGLTLFNKLKLIKYNPNGPSPLKSVDKFPKGIPVVFITSKIDKEVPCENTERIAHTLAKKGDNDVYLLKLDNSSHPNYMFDDTEDRNKYEAFIHAIYRKYGLQHNKKLADAGNEFMELSNLSNKVEGYIPLLKSPTH